MFDVHATNLSFQLWPGAGVASRRWPASCRAIGCPFSCEQTLKHLCLLMRGDFWFDLLGIEQNKDRNDPANTCPSVLLPNRQQIFGEGLSCHVRGLNKQAH